jgi:HK97 gp10 family phage protein
MQFNFRIEGGDELERVLRRLPRGVARSQLRSALKHAAKPMVRDARTRARSASWRSGDMAKSIKARVMKNTVTPAAISLGPSREHWYGVLFERGFRSRPAEPFLRPAWDANRKRFVSEFGDSLWHVLNRLAGRLKKQAYAGKLSRTGRRTLGL